MPKSPSAAGAVREPVGDGRAREGAPDSTVGARVGPAGPAATARPGGPGPAAGTSRRGRPGYDLASLLRVSVEVFNERGYDGTSMEDLAARLGITKSSIYHHVAGKAELLRLAADRALDALFAVTAEPAATTGPAIDRLEHVVRRSVQVLAAELPYVTLLLRLRGNTPVERAALHRRRDFDRVVSQLVAAAERDGDVRPDLDPELTSRLLFGLVNSLTEWYRPDGGLAAADLAEAVVRTAFDGLRRQRPESPPVRARKRRPGDAKSHEPRGTTGGTG